MSDAMREEIRNQVLVHLRDALGLPEAVCASLVETASQNLKQAYDDAQAALAAADFAEAARVGHRMKGNMLNAGLSEGAALAVAFEKAVAGKADDGDGHARPEEAGVTLERLGRLLFG